MVSSGLYAWVVAALDFKLVTIAVVVGLLGVFGLAVWLSRALRDKTAQAAVEMGRSGAAAEGLNILRRRIEAVGPSADRLNALGTLLNLSGEPGEALKALASAESLLTFQDRSFTPLPMEISCNRMRALRALNRAAEALDLGVGLLAKNREAFRVRVELLLTLAQLGRWDDARSELVRLERQFEPMKGAPFAAAQEYQRLLQVCQARLSHAPH